MTPRLRPGWVWPSDVDLVVFDFDGVMTDNTVWVHQDGTEAVRCHRGDGLGIAKLLDAGFSAMVLSTETNPVVAARCAKLHLPLIQGSADKETALRELVAASGLDLDRTVYVGNDANDVGCLRLAGLPVVVADATGAVRDEAALILDVAGGRGAVREICDLIVEHSRPAPRHVDWPAVAIA